MTTAPTSRRTSADGSERPTSESDGAAEYMAPEHRHLTGNCACLDPDDERERAEELGTFRRAWMRMEHL